MSEAIDGKSLVKDCTTATFRADVIAESGRQPVLVDFWAPWSGPCKQLSPVLEKVVKAAGGKAKLVRMNIEEHPQIAGQLGVQSLPAVYVFQKGQPVDGFAGALPESQIKRFLERLVGPLGGENEELIAEAVELLAADDAAGAAALFAEALATDPADVAAIGGLARALTELGEFDQARETLAKTPGGFENDQAIVAARAALENATQAEALGDTADLERRVASDPQDFQARLDLAIALNARDERERAADALLDIIKRNRTWNDDAARKQLLQFFEAWGYMDPDTLAARRKLSTVLFS